MNVVQISSEEFKNLGAKNRIKLSKPNVRRACRLTIENSYGVVIGLGFRVSPQFDYEFYKVQK